MTIKTSEIAYNESGDQITKLYGQPIADVLGELVHIATLEACRVVTNHGSDARIYVRGFISHHHTPTLRVQVGTAKYRQEVMEHCGTLEEQRTNARELAFAIATSGIGRD